MSAEQVRLALVAARPQGLFIPDLMTITGLTKSQVISGILGIRLVAASQHQTPLTYDRKQGYRYSDDPVDWTNFEIGFLKTEATRFLRFLKGTLEPHLARQPDDTFAKMLSDHVNSMYSTIEYDTKQPYTRPLAKRRSRSKPTSTS